MQIDTDPQYPLDDNEWRRIRETVDEILSKYDRVFTGDRTILAPTHSRHELVDRVVIALCCEPRDKHHPKPLPDEPGFRSDFERDSISVGWADTPMLLYVEACQIEGETDDEPTHLTFDGGKMLPEPAWSLCGKRVYECGWSEAMTITQIASYGLCDKCKDRLIKCLNEVSP